MKISCPRCGADVIYDPSEKQLFCEHCNTYSDIKRIKNFKLDLNSTYDEFECSSCGAKLVTDKTTVITRCVFCGSQQMIKQKISGNFKPKRIIPFKISKEEFIKIFKTHINKRIFAPSSFKKNSIITEVKGLYVPFYIYNADLLVHMRGLATKNTNHGEEKKWFECQHEETISIPIDASVKLDDSIMATLEPFDFYDLVEFNPSYLAGFQADCLDEPIETIYSKVDERIIIPSNSLNDDMPGYEQKSGVRFYDIKQQGEPEYILLPIWFFNLNHEGKKYSYAVNGQTGKVVGEVPLDKVKYYLMLKVFTVLLIRNSNFSFNTIIYKNWKCFFGYSLSHIFYGFIMGVWYGCILGYKKLV